MENKRLFETVEQGTHYELPTWKVVDGIGIEKTGKSLPLKFVRGSKLKEEDVEKREGILHETLLSAIIEDLKFKNSIVPSRETSVVITKLQEGLMWMEERQKQRELKGIVGTYKK